VQGKIPLLIALIFGAISFFGILTVLDTGEVDTSESRMLVFNRDMAEGDIVKDDDFAVMRLPGGGVTKDLKGLLTPGSESSVRGAKLLSSVDRGTPVLKTLFTSDSTPQKEIRFTELLKPGERAISLPVDSAGMVTGLLQPGDFVDVLANIDLPVVSTKEMNIPNQGIVKVEETNYEPTTVFLLERVRILAIGANYLKPENAENRVRSFSGSTVTIAVSSRAAQVLSFAMRHGRSPGSAKGVTFTLLLRNALDSEISENREKVTYENVLQEAKLNEIQSQLRP
jgi:pilus assembly protein CpaB